jgi:23S rRNA G2445 N2-methylase RlmL
MIVDDLRIIGSTQTNVVMAAELKRVATRALHRKFGEPRKEGQGQLVLPFDRDLAWAATAYMRTPTRVLWDVYRSSAMRLEPLYDDLFHAILDDDRPLWRDGDGISVEARRVDAFPAGERQVVGTVKNAIIDAARRRGARLHVDPDGPATRWVVRLVDREPRRGHDDAHGRDRQDDARGPHDRHDDRGRDRDDGEFDVVVSIDLGGGSLSQRGWRRSQGDAPLREHLAAVLLMLCRFDPRTDVLVDPMCGSGTIPIEAVLAARAAPRDTPGLRALGMARRSEPLFADSSPITIGCDLDLEVLAAARDNARAAGVQVTWQRADVVALRPETIDEIVRERGGEPRPGLILSNPPYGERLSDHELGDTYEAIAEGCRRFRGWRAGFLVGSPLFEPILTRALGRPRIKKPLANANLRAYFFLWDL